MADKNSLEGIQFVPASRSRARAEAAMPGTSQIKPILTLIPPPADEERIEPDPSVERDYGPNPIAEFALTAPSRAVFSPQSVGKALSAEFKGTVGNVTYYVRTPTGRTTYLHAGGAPTEAVALIAAWLLDGEDSVDFIEAAAESVGAWLSTRPEGFTPWHVDSAALNRQAAAAARILAVAPEEVGLLLLPNEAESTFDGKRVWHVLHAVGLRWGNLDQFHWDDPTDQVDSWFSAFVDDGDLGYALPEEIATGRQHFNSIFFGFEVPPTPHPKHVLQQMIRAAEAAALELNGRLLPYMDSEPCNSLADLEIAVQGAVDQLAALNFKPGSTPVRMLR